MTEPQQNSAAIADDIARVFALQQAHQWDVKASTADQRKAKLAKLKSAVEAHADAIVAAVLEDTRKPEGEIRTTEVLGVMGNIQRNIDNLDAWMAPTEITPSLNPNDRAQIVSEARGVCLILGPWNFPLGLTFGPVAAAIAAGNCCMVKLTDLCPATARIAGEIIRETFDENEVALFEGDVGVATALLELPFNHIFFTGSTRVGKLVMAAAAKHLATVTLELGGKSPVIVDDSADIEKVAADLANAKQFNGGQACICPDYVLVKADKQARWSRLSRPMSQRISTAKMARSGRKASPRSSTPAISTGSRRCSTMRLPRARPWPRAANWKQRTSPSTRPC